MSTDEQRSDDERIEAILGQLQEEIGRHRLALGQLGALDPPDHLAQVRQHKWVNPHLPIGWPVMPKGIVAKLVAMTQKVVRRLLRWYINPIVDQQNHFNEAVFERLQADQSHISQIAGSLHALEDTVTGDTLRREALLSDVRALTTQVERLQTAVEAHQNIIHDERERRTHDQEVTRFRLQRLENAEHQAGASTTPVPLAASAQPQAPAIDYYLLGLTHRSEKQLLARLTDYDDLVANGLPGPALDLGCGRGDLVQHLAELGISAHGVDMDGDAVRMGQEMGRDIQIGDMHTYLETVADSSLGAVFMIQVAEHLPIATLQAIMARILTKLAPGGFLVIETINPTCLTALTNAYLLDPSHVYPLHPMMTQFLLEGAGYADVTIRYLHNVQSSQKLAPLPEPQSMTDKVMAGNIERLNGMLYGAQDYAAIARKASVTHMQEGV